MAINLYSCNTRIFALIFDLDLCMTLTFNRWRAVAMTDTHAKKINAILVKANEPKVTTCIAVK